MRTRVYRAWCSVMLTLLAGTTACRSLTPEQKAHLEKMREVPTRFALPVEKGEEAWSRAQVFISKHASMKIQVATDSVIETYNPTLSQSAAWSYRVTRVPRGDEVEFEVECFSDWTVSLVSPESLEQNAGFLAHYMQTGELEHPELIAR